MTSKFKVCSVMSIDPIELKATRDKIVEEKIMMQVTEELLDSTILILNSSLRKE